MLQNRNRASSDKVASREQVKNPPWTKETRMTQWRTQEAEKEITHKTTGMYTCLRAIDKTIVMIHTKIMAKDKTLENVSQSNKIDRFKLSPFAVTRDRITKT